MRKKVNVADLEYIRNHPDKTPNEISEELDLSISCVKEHWAEPAEGRKSPKLGRSKITLNGGGSVYQLTEDIIPERAVKPPTTKEIDTKNGIYRG
jgi:predicted transcriptional regulator